ncbi:hypothetical protein [Methylobacterium haplocladii]|uniref:Uncharacterized protein n=1 Tax=Methylobacterium haplocladii TaxID=1176176 RepID=A0A512IW00_9HYPH|nr:hypothetical protein [Methylobacterium haplocladii]GEP01843.1 hypothetical protein MHA02_42300 [Methylobacterium haplocladii]GLS61065.1 hypothetical protein GCM10007887_37590 [Methylobacterium haplocladii]
MSNSSSSTKTKIKDDAEWGFVCELGDCLEQIDWVVCDRVFRLGERGYSGAERVQLAANEQARLRSNYDPTFEKNWLDAVPDDLVLFWAIGGEDCYIDILAPRGPSGRRRLLPDATPLEFDKRKARLKSVASAARGEALKE